MSQFLYISGPLDEGMVARARKVCDDLRTVTGCRPFAEAQTAEGVLFRNDASPGEAAPGQGPEALHLFGECYGPEGAAWADSDILPSLRSILRERGPNELAGLNGRYFLIVEHEGHIYTACDVGGFWPAYWGSENGRLVMASNPLLVKEALGGSELDPVGVAQTLRFGYQFDPHTVWSRVRTCPPGALLRWQSGSFEALDTCRLPFSRDGFGLTFQRAADEFAEALRSAIAMRVAGRDCTVPLSAGLDSRALAAMSLGEAASASAFTFDWKGAHDVVWGRKVAKKLRLPHETIRIKPAQVAEHGPACWAALGGATDLHMGYYRAALAEAPATKQCLVSGFFGGSITGSNLVRFFKFSEAGPSTCISPWVEHFSASYVSPEEAGSVSRALGLTPAGGALQDAFRYASEPYSRPHDKVMAWYFLTRQRRYMHFVAKVPDDRFHTVTPFLDSRLLRLCLGWPVALRWGKEAYHHFQAVHLPRFSLFPGASDVGWGAKRRLFNSLVRRAGRTQELFSRARGKPQWNAAGVALERVLDRCGCGQLYRECAGELATRGLDFGFRRFALASVVLSAGSSLADLAKNWPAASEAERRTEE